MKIKVTLTREYDTQGDDHAHLFEGVFNDNNDLVTQDLEVILSQANEREGER